MYVAHRAEALEGTGSLCAGLQQQAARNVGDTLCGEGEMISAHLASLRMAALHTIFRARCSWVVWSAERRGGSWVRNRQG